MSATPQHATAGELGVSYTLKELFERVDEKLGRIELKLDGKADREDVAALHDEIDNLKAEVGEIKLWRAKVAGVAAAIGAIIGGSAAAIAQAIGL